MRSGFVSLGFDSQPAATQLTEQCFVNIQPYFPFVGNTMGFDGSRLARFSCCPVIEMAERIKGLLQSGVPGWTEEEREAAFCVVGKPFTMAGGNETGALVRRQRLCNVTSNVPARVRLDV